MTVIRRPRSRQLAKKTDAAYNSRVLCWLQIVTRLFAHPYTRICSNIHCKATWKLRAMTVFWRLKWWVRRRRLLGYTVASQAAMNNAVPAETLNCARRNPGRKANYDRNYQKIFAVSLQQVITCRECPTLTQRCPWIGFIHGLDWIGSDDCYIQNFDGLCFSAKQTKTVLCSLIISDFLHT